MSFLVDANVLSEATRPEPNAPVLDWLERHERDLAVDPVVLGEIRFGILLLPIHADQGQPHRRVGPDSRPRDRNSEAPGFEKTGVESSIRSTDGARRGPHRTEELAPSFSASSAKRPATTAEGSAPTC